MTQGPEPSSEKPSERTSAGIFLSPMAPAIMGKTEVGYSIHKELKTKSG